MGPISEIRRIPSSLWSSPIRANPAHAMEVVSGRGRGGLVLQSLLEGLENDYGRPEVARGKALISVASMLRSYKSDIRKVFAIFQAYGLGRSPSFKDSKRRPEDFVSDWSYHHLLSEEGYIRWWRALSPHFQESWRNAFAALNQITPASNPRDTVEAIDLLRAVVLGTLMRVPRMVRIWIGLQSMRSILPSIPAPYNAQIAKVIGIKERMALRGEQDMSLFDNKGEWPLAYRPSEWSRQTRDRLYAAGMPDSFVREYTYRLVEMGTYDMGTYGRTDSISVDLHLIPRRMIPSGDDGAAARRAQYLSGFLEIRDVIETLLPELPPVEALRIDEDYMKSFRRFNDESLMLPSGMAGEGSSGKALLVGVVAGAAVYAIGARRS